MYLPFTLHLVVLQVDVEFEVVIEVEVEGSFAMLLC